MLYIVYVKRIDDHYCDCVHAFLSVASDRTCGRNQANLMLRIRNIRVAFQTASRQSYSIRSLRTKAKPTPETSRPTDGKVDSDNRGANNGPEGLKESDILEELQSTYRLLRPRDIMDGTSDAIVNISAGVITGFYTVFKSSAEGAYAGAMTSGPIGATIGFCEGIVKGVLAGSIMFVAGGITGTTSFVRGVVNTPESIRNRYKGLEYSKVDGTWGTFNLKKEEQTLLAPNALTNFLKQLEEELGKDTFYEQMSYYNQWDDVDALGDEVNPQLRKRSVKDTSFYDWMDVSVDATPQEIKQAYYKKAKEYHPDRVNSIQTKNQDASSTAATEESLRKQFQRTQYIYSVLSHPKSREIYDKEGKRAVKDHMRWQQLASEDGGKEESQLEDLTTTVLYSVLLGSEKFERYIGELKFFDSQLFRQRQTGNRKFRQHPKVRNFLQRQREVQIALYLDSMCKKYQEALILAHRKLHKEFKQEMARMTDEEELATQRKIMSASHRVATVAFEEMVLEDLQEMCVSPLGASFVRCIGEAMAEALIMSSPFAVDKASTDALSLPPTPISMWFNRGVIRLHQTKRLWSTKWAVAASGIRTFRSVWVLNSLRAKAMAKQKAESANKQLSSSNALQLKKPKSGWDDEEDEKSEAEAEKALLAVLSPEDQQLMNETMSSIHQYMYVLTSKCQRYVS